MKRDIIYGALLLILGIVIGILCRPHRIERVVDIQRDTTILIDTHIVEKPVLVEKYIQDSLLVAVHDTTIVNDTIFVALPIESKTYKGEEYYAEVSGYKPSLDLIQVYPKTEYITETQKEFIRQRNFLAVGTEMEYIDAFHTYIYAEYERMFHKNVGIYGRFLYDVPTKQMGGSVGIKAQLGW